MGGIIGLLGMLIMSDFDTNKGLKNKLYRFDTSVVLLVVFFWARIATPQIRFEFIGDMQSEKIIVFLLLLSIVLKHKLKFELDSVQKIVLALFLVEMLSYALSAYKNVPHAQLWVESYWKLVVVYMLAVMAIDNIQKLNAFILGLMIALVLYQLHSWVDFMLGGSYVFQQGIKRIVGVWSGGGLGSANGFGLLGLFVLPMTVYVYSLSEETWIKSLSIGSFCLCFLSIVFSGTRGALVVALVYILFEFYRHIFTFRLIFSAIIAVIVLSFYLPESMTDRYASIFFDGDEKELTRSEEIAKSSAESRLEGLEDGWRLFIENPILGIGPGGSAYARVKYHDDYYDEEGEVKILQLHNLYGQVVSEIGGIGAILFFLLLFRYIQSARSMSVRGEDIHLNKLSRLLVTMIVAYFMYGMFAHTLYSVYLIILLLLVSASIRGRLIYLRQ